MEKVVIKTIKGMVYLTMRIGEPIAAPAGFEPTTPCSIANT